MFLDEIAANTGIVRRYGRAARGERCRVGTPFGHLKTITDIAAMRSSGLLATALLDGAMNGKRFRAYAFETLTPALRQGDTVILDNLEALEIKSVHEAIEAIGGRLLYHPPFSSDFNPIDLPIGSGRGRLRQDQSHTPIGRAAHRCRPLGCHPECSCRLQTQQMPELLRRRGIPRI
ncbi:transposase [Methylobacterium sp. WL6]|nr:transposase [Methylobacterium sp. WL6]